METSPRNMQLEIVCLLQQHVIQLQQKIHTQELLLLQQQQQLQHHQQLLSDLQSQIQQLQQIIQRHERQLAEDREDILAVHSRRQVRTTQLQQQYQELAAVVLNSHGASISTLKAKFETALRFASIFKLALPNISEAPRFRNC
jgi:uncharacterized protein YbcI